MIRRFAPAVPALAVPALAVPAFAVLALAALASPAAAQTANSSPAAGFGGAGGNGTAGGNVSRTAPSAGPAAPKAGVPQVGPETPVEKNAEEQSRKDTTICKGC